MLRGGQLAAENMRTTSSVRVSLNQIEAVLLAASEPYLNKQGGRFGKRATQFMQIRDERLGITDSEMLREIWERLRES
ncbi:hypothetical protein NOR53_1009 [gamma proteobacterium NOR5-3]|nr:hypothetical protein NOR53_1009 [gamma proteobacterium NOR5-3]